MIIPSSLYITAPYILLLYDCAACPSSNRKYYELKDKGEDEPAGIFGNKASPSAVQYFKKKHDKTYRRLSKNGHKDLVPIHTKEEKKNYTRICA